MSGWAAVVSPPIVDSGAIAGTLRMVTAAVWPLAHTACIERHGVMGKRHLIVRLAGRAHSRRHGWTWRVASGDCVWWVICLGRDAAWV
eukprot:6089091-Prymnesium_polylepis.1